MRAELFAQWWSWMSQWLAPKPIPLTTYAGVSKQQHKRQLPKAFPRVCSEHAAVVGFSAAYMLVTTICLEAEGQAL